MKLCGNSGIADSGVVFRNSDGELLLCFADPLGFASSYQAELSATMTVIEVAHCKN
jgi:hypothetical protein